MPYTWLLFDADDTLFDYSRAETSALQGTFEELGMAFEPEFLNIYKRYNQQVWQEFERGHITTLELRIKRFRLLFTEIGVPSNVRNFSVRYLKNHARSSHLFEDVIEILQVLSSRYHLALVTNGLSEVQRPRLERSAIRPFIEKIFISEEIGVAKPETGFFDAVFREIGHPARSQVLIIGDSLSSDMQGGINYGIDTCWFNPGGKTTELPVTYKINTLKQLLDILE
jgi:2-haloacid dehalogenase